MTRHHLPPSVCNALSPAALDGSRGARAGSLKPDNLFAGQRPSKLHMKRSPACVLPFNVALFNVTLLNVTLLSFALLTGGCKTVPEPQPTQTASRYDRSASDEDYNRGYQTEAHHRHRHGRREEEPNDNWTGYDRPETADEGSGGYLPRQSDSGSNNADSAPAERSSRHHNSRALTAAPGQFDFYVLNLSWSPEFCHGHPAAAECAQHRAFTLHGLWPQNNDGTYPENCSDGPGPARPSQYADSYPDPTLLQHEWQTHGTCSGLAPDQFFPLARRAEEGIHIPAELAHLSQQTTLAPAEIITLFSQNNPAIPASSVAISCGNNYLTAVEVCLDKTLKPESCSGLKTCRASEVRIPAPQ